MGALKLQVGDGAGGLVAYEQGLDIARKLAALVPNSANAQRDIAISLDSVGGVKLLTGDRAGAVRDFRESLAIRRRMADQDPSNAHARGEVAVSLGDSARFTPNRAIGRAPTRVLRRRLISGVRRRPTMPPTPGAAATYRSRWSAWAG